MLKSQVIYIDLGTSHTVIYVKGRGFVLDQPTYLATRKRSLQGEDLVAMGDSALKMFGRTPANIQVLQPLQEGVIADFTRAVSLLHSFLQPMRSEISWRKPHLLISLPENVTMHEREAVRELGREMGASRVDLLAEPLLAALGLGLPVLAHQGEMVVDLGAGTSEAAIFSGGGSVVTAATRIGGDHLTDAIIQHLFVKNHWVVGHHAAEELKAQVGSLDPLSMQKALPVVVQNTVTGLPKKVHVTGSMILEPISHYARQISELVSRVLEECPPELSGDLTERGLHLSGGAALLHGLDAYLSERLGLQVRLGSEPRRAVSMGGAKVLNDLSLLERLQVPL